MRVEGGKFILSFFLLFSELIFKQGGRSKACLACQVSQNKCSMDGKPVGPKKCPHEDKPDSHSPKKAWTTTLETMVAPVPQVDKEG
jgi:hypothetical protein